MDKFMGRPKGQKAAATSEVGEVEVSTPEEISEDSEKETAAASTMTTLGQLMEQQKALADQIAAWREQDF
jgi:hypothetical protein